MGKMRSPNYPAVGLTEALKLSEALWAREKRTYVSPEAAVAAWGYSGMSGNARTKLGALRRYGLLDEGNEGTVRLSDLAMEIVHHPDGSPERISALKAAAVKPELFRDLYKTHLQSSDQALRSHLITRLDFSDSGAQNVIEAFRDTISMAKLDVADLEPGAAEEEKMAPSYTSHQEESRLGPDHPTERAGAAPGGTTYRWPLSKDVVVEVRFTGTDLRPAHLELLRKYLELAKTAMQAEIGDESV